MSRRPPVAEHRVTDEFIVLASARLMPEEAEILYHRLAADIRRSKRQRLDAGAALERLVTTITTMTLGGFSLAEALRLSEQAAIDFRKEQTAPAQEP